MAVRAPDFRPGLEWINTAGRQYSLADFRGRFLLLDFWTYGCINCIHMVPHLREIERRFPDEVAVVGVHSAKYPQERITNNIARACERLGVTHPVVNDRQLRMWHEYAVRAWPTLVLISPTGYVLEVMRGEVTAKALVPLFERAIHEAAEADQLKAVSDLVAEPDEQLPQPGVMRFPAKLCVTEDNRVFIADTGHHRILEIALEPDRTAGQVTGIIGSGRPGWQDGESREACFRAPHGLTVAHGKLYVADTENHLIREVDLDSRQVSTIAGTGVQALPTSEDGPAKQIALNSPWDLLWVQDSLYVAMAGAHQLWKMDVFRGWAEVFAGSGAEQLYDAPLLQAALAQPSGLASDGQYLYFADPEASAIRQASVEEGVSTLVGTGLFDSGDRDGIGDHVRLQHPLGVAYWKSQNKLLVADTYNSCIKLIDPVSSETVTFISREAGGFWEPGGIAIAPDERHAFVADTNNHRVCMIDLVQRTVVPVRIAEWRGAKEKSFTTREMR